MALYFFAFATAETLADPLAEEFDESQVPAMKGGPATEARNAFSEGWDKFWDLTVPTNSLNVWRKKQTYGYYLEYINWNWGLQQTEEELDLQVELFGLAWAESFNLHLTDDLSPEDVMRILFASWGQ